MRGKMLFTVLQRIEPGASVSRIIGYSVCVVFVWTIFASD